MIAKPSIEHLQGIIPKCNKDLNFWIGLYHLYGIHTYPHLGVDLVISLLLVQDGKVCEFSRRLRTLQINEFSWNYLINGYAKHGDPRNVLFLFDRMREDFLYPSGYAIVSVLNACAKLKAYKTGKEIHAHLLIHGLLGSNPFISTALVDMYAKCGMIAEAEEVFRMLPHRNTVTWNALIAGYVRCELTAKAIHCFLQMREQGASPDAVTYACIFKAFSRIEFSDIEASIGEFIHEIHAEVERKGILYANMVVGTCLVEMFVQWGMLAKAHEVFDNLPMRNVVVWTSLIGGYVQHDY